MLFVDCVNRIFRKNGVIRGDTDALTNFSGLQHNATMNIAMIAVQDAISDLVMEKVLPPTRRTQATLTMVNGTRTYQLAADFQRFWDDIAQFFDPVSNINIFHYPGGEQRLRIDIPDYAIAGRQVGYPNWFYHLDAATPSVGFYQTPDSTVNGRLLYYDYQKQVVPTNYNDVLPFQSDAQAFAFTEMASIRYALMMANDPVGGRISERVDIRTQKPYVSAMAKTIDLVNPSQKSRRYGHVYISPVDQVE